METETARTRACVRHLRFETEEQSILHESCTKAVAGTTTFLYLIRTPDSRAGAWTGPCGVSSLDISCYAFIQCRPH